jgi:crotonobetainyl-CoA:carnitine CoA-transferase CaiB-like acyl-CoA transferase
VDDIIGDAHLAGSGFFAMTDHPSEGRLRMMAPPTTWSGTPTGPLRPAPRLGEHSAEVLREAGYSDEEIAALAAGGATRLAERRDG